MRLPDRPFSPWLRLAHIGAWRSPDPHARAGVRRIRDWEFIVVLEGASWMATAAGRWPLPAGSVTLVPPDAVVDWGTAGHRHLAVHFDLHARPSLGSDRMLAMRPGAFPARLLPAPPCWRLGTGGEALDIPWTRQPAVPALWHERFLPLVRMWTRGDHARPERRLEAAGILAAAVHDWLELAHADAAEDPAMRRVRELLDRLALAPDRHLDAAGLARLAGLPEGALRRAFAVLTGTTPRRWLERRRIALAARLLDGGASVAAAAQAAGYDDPFHFSRVFRRVAGRAPRGLRRRISGG